MAAPRKTTAASRTGGKASKQGKYETIQFAASGGTRALYRRAAELEGMELNEWMRAALFAHAERVLAEHGVDDHPMPSVQPERPQPLPLRRR